MGCFPPRLCSDFSTHILTRRMTVENCTVYVKGRFSTHILTRRMTHGDPENQSGHGFFNSHPHKEDDHPILVIKLSRILFNSHPHKEDDMQWWENPRCKIFFNSHPHKEDDKAKRLNKLNRQFFNSHPHKEDDATDHWFDTAKDFSTHILTRRMTERDIKCKPHKTFQLTSSQGG